jgi:membrane protein implicated in regulation of membrane protease activity
MDAWLNGADPHWFWLSIGLALAVLEMLMPGFFLIWLAGAAIVTGLVAWVVPIGFVGQVALFAVLAIGAVFAARRYMRDNPIESSDPLLNQRGARYVGQVLTLVTAIEDGRGRAKVADGEWPVQGPDAAAGSKVRVVSAEGGLLIVEQA